MKENIRKTIKKLIREVVEESIETAIRADIVKFVAENSYFDFDGEDDEKTLTFSTRKNGNVGNEEPGEEDIKEGKKIAREILSNFKNASVSLEVVDEWVMLLVKERRPKETKTSYAFIKHSEPDFTSLKSRGFSKGFDDIEDLREMVERFLPEVDFTKIEVELEDLKLNPAHSFRNGTLNFRQGKILISKPKENSFGYYFSIMKTQQEI